MPSAGLCPDYMVRGFLLASKVMRFGSSMIFVAPSEDISSELIPSEGVSFAVSGSPSGVYGLTFIAFLGMISSKAI